MHDKKFMLTTSYPLTGHQGPMEMESNQQMKNWGKFLKFPILEWQVFTSVLLSIELNFLGVL